MASKILELRRKANGSFDNQDSLSYVRTNWSGIDGKPSVFTPSGHTHPISQVTGLLNGDGKINDSLINANFTDFVRRDGTISMTGDLNMGSKVVKSVNRIDFAETMVSIGTDTGGHLNLSAQESVTLDSELDFRGYPGVGLADPINPQDASTKKYVDDIAATKQNALGFTPENVANKKTTLSDSDLDYPTSKAVKTAIETAVSQTLKPMGNWNANTNTPALTNSNINKANEMYYVNVAGTQFGIKFDVGDELVYNTNGVIFRRDNVDAVVSVNTKQGVVVLNQDDIGDGTTYKRVTQTEKNAWMKHDGTISMTGDLNMGSKVVKSVNRIDFAETMVSIGTSTGGHLDLSAQESVRLDSELDFRGYPAVGLANPTNAQDASTKKYVDDIAATKQNALGFTPVTNARTIAGLDLTANRTRDAIIGVSANGYLRRTGANTYDIRTVANLKTDLGFSDLLKHDGTISMTGDLNMGSKVVKSVNRIDFAETMVSIGTDTGGHLNLSAQESVTLDSELDFRGYPAVGLANPTNAQDASTKKYVDDIAATKQNALGFTPENVANKKTSIRTSGADDTSYVSELGVKKYVDGLIGSVYRPSGDWNASTNSPTLANNTPANSGKVYRVSVAGTRFGFTFAVGDKLAFNESGVISKWDNVDDVVTVNGKAGTVVLTTDDINEGTNLYVSQSEKDTWDGKTTQAWVTANTRSNAWVPTWAQVTGKPSWIGSSKPSYNLDDISDGSTYKRVTQAEKNAWMKHDGTISMTGDLNMGSKVVKSVNRIDFAETMVSIGTDTGGHLNLSAQESVTLDSELDFRGYPGVGLADPINPQDATTKKLCR